MSHCRFGIAPMPLDVHLPPEIEALADKLASAQGVTVEQAVAKAVEESAARAGLTAAPKRKLSREELIAKVDEISRRSAALPVFDTRTDDEIIGYNEFGVPE